MTSRRVKTPKKITYDEVWTDGHRTLNAAEAKALTELLQGVHGCRPCTITIVIIMSCSHYRDDHYPYHCHRGHHRSFATRDNMCVASKLLSKKKCIRVERPD